MKLLIASDTHHCIGNLYDAIEREMPDTVIHLGDYRSDAEELACVFPRVAFCTVPGNCDYDWVSETDKVIDFGGVRIFMTHGHRYGVKGGCDALFSAAKRVGARIALFGHTHRPYRQERDGVLLLNPGAQRFIRLTIENGSFACEFLEDQGE